MDERMPWPTWTAAAALGLVFGVWLVGLVGLMMGAGVGWLWIALGGWLTAGMLYTALRYPGDSPNGGES